MRLNEISGREPIIISMTRKLLATGHDVLFDFLDKQRDYSDPAVGKVEAVGEMQNAAVGRIFVVSYRRRLATGNLVNFTQEVLFSEGRLKQLHLYKNDSGTWLLTHKEKPAKVDEGQHEGPLWLSMANKLLAAGKGVYYRWPRNMPSGVELGMVTKIESDFAGEAGNVIDIFYVDHDGSDYVTYTALLVGKRLELVDFQKIDGRWTIIVDKQRDTPHEAK